MRALLVAVWVACAVGVSPAEAQQSLGLRVMTQAWAPAQDDDSVRTALDEPGGITEAVETAWQVIEPLLRQELLAVLGQGDLLADGVTLGNIELTLPAPVLNLTHLEGGNAAPLRLRLTLTIAGLGLEATSTTPGPLPSAFDPRCSFRADAALNLDLTIGGDPRNAIAVRPAQGVQMVQITGFDWDSQGVSCDIIKAVVGLLFGESVIRQAAEGLGSSTASGFAAGFVGSVAAQAAAVNQRIGAVVPPGLVAMQQWLQGPRLTLAFSTVPGAVFLSPRAVITGRLRVSQIGTLQAGGAPTIDCMALPLRFRAKTGPRPILNPNGTLGDAPFVPLVTTGDCDGAVPGVNAGHVGYRIRGLSAELPNYFESSGFAAACRQGDAWMNGTAAGFSNHSGPRILSGELGRRLDLTISLLRRPCIVFNVAVDQQIRTRPPEEPGFIRLDLRTLATMIEQAQAGRGVAQALNPQPLPPEPPDQLVLRDLARLQLQQGELLQRLQRR